MNPSVNYRIPHFILLLLMVSLIVVGGIVACRLSSYTTEQLPEKTSVPRNTAKNVIHLIEHQTIPEPSRPLYGIISSGLKLVKGEVQKGEILGNILKRYKVSANTVDAITNAAEGVWDIRKIQRGSSYALFLDPLQEFRPLYFIHEINPVDFVVVDLGTTVSITPGQKEVTTVETTASSRIENTLWDAFISNGLDFSLALKLADIFAWSVDFYHLQNGDGFEFVYEENQVDGQTVGYGRILSACFIRGEERAYAFFYKQNGKGEYFNENGESLQKTFLKAPLKYSRISSNFTHKRLHPILKRYRPHLGVDYAAPKGTPVMAVADGTIIKANYGKDTGKNIKIRHNAVYTTQYIHLSKFHQKIKSGVKVKQGDVIGYVGSTGLSTGPHLDYRIWKNGKAINPLKMKAPSKNPVLDHFREDFFQKTAHLKKMLDEIDRGTLHANLAEKSATTIQ